MNKNESVAHFIFFNDLGITHKLRNTNLTFSDPL